MKCPHRLEPHQIQGLDFIHIFPVIQVCIPETLEFCNRVPHLVCDLMSDSLPVLYDLQWLVKRAIETREEMGDYVRAYSASQFQKTHSFPEVSAVIVGWVHGRDIQLQLYSLHF